MASFCGGLRSFGRYRPRHGHKTHSTNERASTAAIILDLAMVVMAAMTTIIGTRGGDGGAWCRTEVRGSGYPGRPGYGGIGAADAERHVYERASVRHHHETLHIWNHYFAVGPNTSVLATLRIEHHTTRRLIAAARQAMLMHTQTT